MGSLLLYSSYSNSFPSPLIIYVYVLLFSLISTPATFVFFYFHNQKFQFKMCGILAVLGCSDDTQAKRFRVLELSRRQLPFLYINLICFISFYRDREKIHYFCGWACVCASDSKSS
uniref:Uncharacterized protein n=1 Tax=Cannabis sativa TaxID=3483 RepID=A0A803R6J3_CANSA